MNMIIDIKLNDTQIPMSIYKVPLEAEGTHAETANHGLVILKTAHPIIISGK